MSAAIAIGTAPAVAFWWPRALPDARPLIILYQLVVLWALRAVLALPAVEAAAQIFWFKSVLLRLMPIATTWLCFVPDHAGSATG